MKFLARLVVAVALNAVGVWAAATWIPGFVVTGALLDLVKVALILTAINLFIKPVAKLVLGPLIVLTLGLGLLLVNVAVLYLLDIVTRELTIETLPALIYASFLFGALNVIFHLATKE